jgi:hypothetical protein
VTDRSSEATPQQIHAVSNSYTSYENSINRASTRAAGAIYNQQIAAQTKQSNTQEKEELVVQKQMLAALKKIPGNISVEVDGVQIAKMVNYQNAKAGRLR